MKCISHKDEIVINVADKSLGFVINTTWYVNELKTQLNDDNTYIEIFNWNTHDIIYIDMNNPHKLRGKYLNTELCDDITDRLTIWDIKDLISDYHPLIYLRIYINHLGSTSVTDLLI